MYLILSPKYQISSHLRLTMSSPNAPLTIDADVRISFHLQDQFEAWLTTMKHRYTAVFNHANVTNHQLYVFLMEIQIGYYSAPVLSAFDLSAFRRHLCNPTTHSIETFIAEVCGNFRIQQRPIANHHLVFSKYATRSYFIEDIWYELRQTLSMMDMINNAGRERIKNFIKRALSTNESAAMLVTQRTAVQATIWQGFEESDNSIGKLITQCLSPTEEQAEAYAERYIDAMIVAYSSY